MMITRCINACNIIAALIRVATGQEMVRGKKFSKVREKSGNFILSQRKLTFLGKLEEIKIIEYGSWNTIEDWNKHLESL